MGKVILTDEQFNRLIAAVVGVMASEPAAASNGTADFLDEDVEKIGGGRRYVYGLKGICDLFQISRVTAWKYKNSWLKPAISQRGRKIIVDVNQAMKLYDENAGVEQ